MRGRDALLVLAACSAGSGCALFGGQDAEYSAVILYSIAENAAYHVKAYSVEGNDSRGSGLGGALELMPYTMRRSTFWGGEPPRRIRLEWNYDSPPARYAEFDTASWYPENGLGTGGIVLLITGRDARIGWMQCPKGGVFTVRSAECTPGGALADPVYANAIPKRDPLPVPVEKREPVPKRIPQEARWELQPR